jgi:hypothetical protein
MSSSTIKSPLIFTRYLYLKDEVSLSLLVSILNKKKNALYWAYELYYSGFEEELFQHLWKIYYDFYYTLNPSFQNYFVKKYKEWKKISNSDEKARIVALIVGDLMIRPYNLDVFMLRQSVNYATDETPITTPFSQLLETRNYLSIANFILERKIQNYEYMLKEAFDFFIKKGIKIDTEKTLKQLHKTAGFLHLNASVQLLAQIMLYFSQLQDLPMGKKLYIMVEQHDLVIYETIFVDETTNYRAYKMLPMAYLYKIDEDHYLSLFQLERNKILMDNPNGLKEIYHYNWEYYASFSPIWSQRIQTYKGKFNHEVKRVMFPEDEEIDWTEEFYSRFGYEPDEQKRETQEHSIQTIESHRSWRQFFEEHGKNGLYKPEGAILDEMKIILY